MSRNSTSLLEMGNGGVPNAIARKTQIYATQDFEKQFNAPSERIAAATGICCRYCCVRPFPGTCLAYLQNTLRTP